MTWAVVYIRLSGSRQPYILGVRLAASWADAEAAAVARVDKRGAHADEMDTFRREFADYGQALMPNRDNRWEDQWVSIVRLGEPVPELNPPDRPGPMQAHEYEYPD